MLSHEHTVTLAEASNHAPYLTPHMSKDQVEGAATHGCFMPCNISGYLYHARILIGRQLCAAHISDAAVMHHCSLSGYVAQKGPTGRSLAGSLDGEGSFSSGLVFRFWCGVNAMLVCAFSFLKFMAESCIVIGAHTTSVAAEYTYVLICISH